MAQHRIASASRSGAPAPPAWSTWWSRTESSARPRARSRAKCSSPPTTLRRSTQPGWS